MITLGLSPIVHESAVGLVIDGKLVGAASEERFTRQKNQGGFPHQALQFVLSQAGIAAKDVEHLAYASLTNQAERQRDLVNYVQNIPYVMSGSDKLQHKAAHLANYTRTMARRRGWFSQGGTQQVVHEALAEHGLEGKLEYVDHHLAHCASAYFCSGFSDTLVVSLDGYGSGAAGSFYAGRSGKLTKLATIPYPHSLGTFYRRVTQALGYRPNRHEGKVVGLAAYGDPTKAYEEMRRRVDLTHPDYFRLRSVQDPFFEKRLLKKYEPADLAAAAQAILENIVVHYVRGWLSRTGLSRVACAGGVFANVKMNQRVAELDEVEGLFVFPAMGDSGVGTGAAFALQAQRSNLRPQEIEHMYLGPSFSTAEIEAAVTDERLTARKSDNIADEVAQRLQKDQVVARFDGAMEFGPRALGNRSILYSAHDPSVNDWLNKRLKRTEFMPFAPITLGEHADARFLHLGRFRHSAQFMTVTTDCTDTMKKESPAAVHVDGTARPQIVESTSASSVRAILERYHAHTGVPTLINTSFNMHEEPIVCTPDDAVRAFLDGDLETLAIGDFLVERKAAPQAPTSART